jgi:outer membrane immunogenic protein
LPGSALRSPRLPRHFRRVHAGSRTHSLGRYVAGAQVGTSNFNADFANAPGSLVAYILHNTTVEDQFAPSSWTALSKTTTNSMQYGFFAGYNTQWDCLVIGVDGAYNRVRSLTASSSDSIGRIVTTSDNRQHDATISASSWLKLIDYATARVRAGYAVGEFLPAKNGAFSCRCRRLAASMSLSSRTRSCAPSGDT